MKKYWMLMLAINDFIEMKFKIELEYQDMMKKHYVKINI